MCHVHYVHLLRKFNQLNAILFLRIMIHERFDSLIRICIVKTHALTNPNFFYPTVSGCQASGELQEHPTSIRTTSCYT